MNSHQYKLKNMELAGTLEEQLRLMRQLGKSYRTIAKELSRSGIPVARATVDKWCHELLIEKGSREKEGTN